MLGEIPPVQQKSQNQEPNKAKNKQNETKTKNHQPILDISITSLGSITSTQKVKSKKK